MNKEFFSHDPQLVLNICLENMVAGNLQSVSLYMEEKIYYIDLIERISSNVSYNEYKFKNTKIELDYEEGEKLLVFLLQNAEKVRNKYSGIAMAGLWLTRNIGIVRDAYLYPYIPESK